MKKFLSLLLAALMLLSLCACGGSSGGNDATEAPSTLLVGYGMVDITPKQFGIPMDGHGNTNERLSTGLMSYIYAIAVAVTDAEGNTAVMMAVDSCSTGDDIHNSIRSWAENEHGIPSENILISCIHQHTCPDSSAAKYNAQYMQGLKDAISAAVEDRAPAEMYTNRVETKAMNAVRRYWLNDGGFVTSHSCTGDKASGFKDYESAADPEMRLIKFTREDKEDIIMVNFQAHPHMSSGGTVTEIGADWPGLMRETVAKELGVNVVYFSGAGGNMNSTSANKEHNVSTDWKDHGKRAAKYVMDAEDSYTKAKVGAVVCKEVSNIYETDHTLDHLLDAATIVNNARSVSSAHAAEVLKQYPELNSKFQASAVVTKATAGPTKECTISAITFGDVAFTVHPYEMFSTSGMDLRNGTVGNSDYAAEDQLENPFAMTFITTISNGSNGYIPTAAAFDNGGYERDCTRYARGTGELLVGDYLHLLNELYVK